MAKIYRPCSVTVVTISSLVLTLLVFANPHGRVFLCHYFCKTRKLTKMETIQKSKVNRSLALTSDAHLSQFHSQTEVFQNCVKFKEYAYIDYDVVSGGAIFFFVPFNSYMSENWDCKDTLEIFVGFTEQRLYKEAYSATRGVHMSDEFRLIDNDHEKFDMVEGLMEAELKAFEYINNK